MKPCPCGKTPTELKTHSGIWDKWIVCSPNCCSEWMFEFRNKHTAGPEELKAIAEAAWDALPRASQ